jgi:hypothetical protein
VIDPKAHPSHHDTGARQFVRTLVRQTTPEGVTFGLRRCRCAIDSGPSAIGWSRCRAKASMLLNGGRWQPRWQPRRYYQALRDGSE